MGNEPRGVPVPYPVQPPRGQMAPGSGSPLLQGAGMADTRVTIRMRPGAGIGVEYLGESVKLSLDLSTLGEMPPATGDGTYYTIVYDPETGMTWRVEVSAGGALPYHTHVEGDVENLVQDLAARPVDAPSDGAVYSRQNGTWVVVGGVVGWDDIVGVPDTFPPDPHTHPIAEVEQLPETLITINETFLDVADSLQDLYDVKIGEAPDDGQQYARQNLDWVAVDIPPPLDAYTKAEADTRYVNVAGDSMTGALQIPVGSQTAVSLHFGNTQTGLFGSSSQVNISVSGSARMTFASTAIIANLPLRAVAGTAALPAYAFTSFTNMGLYATSATELDFSVGGARKLKMETASITADVPIVLPANPANALEAAPKQYVDLRELAANKGAVNGYAPLDGSAKVPAINLPAYVDDVLEYANLAAFPATGTVGVIYIALDTNKTYRWGGSSYTEISPSPGSTDAVSEGSTNKYYTDERVDDRAAALIRNGSGITWVYDDTAGTLTPTVSVGNSQIQGDAVGNSQLANMPANTMKGNNTASVDDAKDLTTAEVKTLLNYTSRSGDTMTGGLLIDCINASLTLNKRFSGESAWLVGKMNAATRWTLLLGDSTAESGANVGSDFTVTRHADGGASLGDVLKIKRSTGVVDFAVAPTVAGVPLGGGGSAITVADTAPGSPAANSLWWESDTGGLFLYYNDGNTSQYVQVNGSYSVYGIFEFANLAAFPATGSTGAIYIALDTNKIYRWSGSAYVEISPSPAPVDAYTKTESDARYEPLDSAYTKAESDGRYAPKATISTSAPSGGVDGDVWYQVV